MGQRRTFSGLRPYYFPAAYFPILCALCVVSPAGVAAPNPPPVLYLLCRPLLHGLLLLPQTCLPGIPTTTPYPLTPPLPSPPSLSLLPALYVVPTLPIIT